MTYNTNSHISNVLDVERFFEHIVKDRCVNFHPDNDFEDYINRETCDACFTDEEIPLYNRLMEESFVVCENNGSDIYEIGLKALGLDWMLEDVA